MTFGIQILGANGLPIFSSDSSKPKVLLRSGAASLVGGSINSLWTPYVGVSINAGEFVGFELLEGSIFYGACPGTTANSFRLLTNKATNYAVIGDGNISAGFGIEIFDGAGVKILSDNTAVWPRIGKYSGSSASYSHTWTVPSTERVFVFGKSASIINIANSTITYAGLRRSGNNIYAQRGTYGVSTSAYLGTGSLNFGERTLGAQLFSIASI